MATSGFDYIVTGGGSAGCVLAARLSEDPSVQVLLLEAGPPADSLWMRMPAGMGRLFMNSTYNWGFMTEPEPRLDGREIYWPQGKTLGGSSSINGMAFVRGHPEDYDGWPQLGAPGWGWEDVLPYFKKCERRAGGGVDRGQDGPLTISDPSYRHPSSQAFVDACASLGLSRNPDYNAGEQGGVSFLQYSIARGRRASSADAYLRPARRRPNLQVVTGAFVRRVVIEGGRAVGVEYEAHGRKVIASADREVVVAGGAIGSPRILLHSGVGPADQLRALGIAVAADLPGVGSDLIDHPYIHTTFATTAPRSLNGQLREPKVYMHGAWWLMTGRGPLTIGASQAAAFIRAMPDAERPDVQVNFRPISFRFDSSGRMGPAPEPQLTAAVCVLRPQSRGNLRLRSADPREPPLIRANYLDIRRDEDTLVEGVRWCREIFAADPLRAVITGEDAPGPAVQSDEDLRRYVRAFVQTMCHPVGSCRMGSDEQAVVDPELRVRGVERLRVVDSSVMPIIVSGNTQAATYMIAEKGADLIRATP